MEVIVKDDKPSKIDHPSRNPNRERWEKKAEERIAKGQLKFENEAAKRDYERSVASNKNNIYGLPNFFPPQEIGGFAGFGDGTTVTPMDCGHAWVRAVYHDDGSKTLQCRHGHSQHISLTPKEVTT